jgi:transposase
MARPRACHSRVATSIRPLLRWTRSPSGRGLRGSELAQPPATRYNRPMIETTLPLAPDNSATGPAPDPAALLEQWEALRLESAALRVENAALRERVHELEARLGQDSSNSSRPPSSDPPQAPRKRRVLPSGRKRGSQPGHRGAFRALLPVEQVDEMVTVVPEGCRHCRRAFLHTTSRSRARVWRHQVVERCINRLKQWRGLATRYEKRTANYRALVVIAALMIWLVA